MTVRGDGTGSPAGTVHELPADGRSAARARRVVADAVAQAGLPGLLDEALLLVTELVTNAYVHAGTPMQLHVAADGGALRVEVADHLAGRLPVAPQAPSDSREGGRGMFLVDALATEWGTRHCSSGKAVWFVLGERAPGRREHPAPAAEPCAGRRDLSWLVDLPVGLEQRLDTPALVGELLHRTVTALDLPGAWLLVQSLDDERTWEQVAASDSGSTAPEADEVRRLAVQQPDAYLPGPGLRVLALRGRSGTFGALVLAGAAQLTPDDVALARLVGDRLGVVLRDDRAVTQAHRSRGSLALLAEASDMFAGTLDVRLTLTLAAQLVVPRFARWSAVLTTYEHRPQLVAVASGDECRLAALRTAMSGPEGQALAERLVDEGLHQRPVLVPAADLPPGLVDGDAASVLAVPLVARRRLLGLLLVGRPGGAAYAPDDVGVLTDLARRAALAVDNARLYEERTSIAQALQASLLPAALPVAAGLELGARYVPAGEGNDVGGDFYDVFPLEDGGFGVTIGDVCGKGAAAAAITGHARDVLRLLTRDGAPAPVVLQRLNRSILEMGERGRLCTTTLGTVRPRAGGLAVRLSSAGHPPPVLLARDGTARFVGGSGTVLGVVPDIEVADDEVLLAPGDALVFYTDGVTERRSGGDMFGDEHLQDCLRRSAGCSADVIAGRLEEAVGRYGDSASRDDLAVLVVRCPVSQERPAIPLQGAPPRPVVH